MTVRERIIEIFDKKSRVRPSELVKELGVTEAVVYRQLGKLVSEGVVAKSGQTPEVYYERVVQNKCASEGILPYGDGISVSLEIDGYLRENYLYVTPDGMMLFGVSGLLEWAQKSGQKQSHKVLIEAFVKVRREYDCCILPDGYVKAKEKIKQTFEKNFLDGVYFSDFYSLPRFGKTKLGTEVYFAKSTENRMMMREIAERIKPTIEKIIKQKKIGVIAYIPHSLPRQTPFLVQLRKDLDLQLPEIVLEKEYRGSVRVAQKSLSRLAERIENASETIKIKSVSDYSWWPNNVLLIDDALGSGATLNEVAKKIKADATMKGGKVYGYAVVGSANGFEVIREV